MDGKLIGILLIAIIVIVSTPLLTIQFLSVSPTPDSNTLIQEAPKTESIAFIKNVLPIDTEKYNITLKKTHSIIGQKRYLLREIPATNPEKHIRNRHHIQE